MTRQRRLATAGFAALVAAALALVPLAPATASSAKAPVGERRVTVMTRNLYLGADLLHLFGGDPLTGAITVLATVEALNPAARMATIADEVAAAKPDVLALQEAAVWHITAIPGTPVQNADYDFVALLRSALAARGTPYSVVVTQKNFDSQEQIPLLGQVLGATYSDHDVLLVRHDVRTSQVQVLRTGAAHYAAQTVIPFGLANGGQLDFERGYEWADLQTRGIVWRVVNTHPEAFNPGSFGLPPEDVNGEEATELATTLAGVTGPVVILGDLNSAKDETVRTGYTRLIDAGFSDTWLALGHDNGDNTCCYNEFLSSGSLYERIDHVLGRGLVQPKVAYHVGVDPEPTGVSLYPTDHAGVVTTFSVGKENG